MLVKDLIAFLQTQPQDMPIAYKCYSEQMLLEVDEITIEQLCLPRNDFWVHDARPDKPTQAYLVFPGN